MPKKLAIYISGHLRTWSEHSKKNLLDLIGNNDADLFIATYHSMDRSESYNGPIIDDEAIKLLFNGFSIKGITIDNDNPTMDPSYKKEQNCLWKVWRKIQQCNTMRIEYSQTNGVYYDYAIRTRPDLLVLETIDFDSLPPLDKNIIISFGGSLGYPDDAFAICSPRVMNHYCLIKNGHCNYHDNLKDTVKVYPILKFIQTGIIRSVPNEEPYKNIIKLDEERYLCYYDKLIFGFK